jgi:hypothetical protein
VTRVTNPDSGKRFTKDANKKNNMTKDEYLDSIKKAGHIIWVCPTCGVRAFGAGTFLHESTHRDHAAMVNEDKIKAVKDNG